MEKAVVSLSIDDSRLNFKNLFYESLLPLKIPSTINVVSGFVNGSVKRDGAKFLSNDQIREFYRSGLIEVANHSRSHTNDTSDIFLGHSDICEMLEIDKNTSLGFASVGSEIKIDKANEIKPELTKLGVKYVRTEDSTKIKNSEELKKRYLLGDNDAYIELQSHVFFEKGDFAISSLVLYRDVNDLKELKLLTDYAVKHKKRFCIMIHNVGRKDDSFYSNPWTFDLDRLKEYLEYIVELRKQEKLEILTVSDSLKAD